MLVGACAVRGAPHAPQCAVDSKRARQARSNTASTTCQSCSCRTGDPAPSVVLSRGNYARFSLEPSASLCSERPGTAVKPQKIYRVGPMVISTVYQAMCGVQANNRAPVHLISSLSIVPCLNEFCSSCTATKRDTTSGTGSTAICERLAAGG